MSATRSSSIRALRQLSSHSHQLRHLHITGPATIPTRALQSESTATASLPRYLKSPRADGVKRGLPTIASKDDSSLSSAASRTIVTAHAPVRAQSSTQPAPQKSNREINTTRSFRAHNDTSTIDFAFFPKESEAATPDSVYMRVPLIPDNYTPNRTGAHADPAPAYDDVMRAQVVTAAGENTFVAAPSAMSEASDNNSVKTDYEALAERMEQTASTVSNKAKQTQGTVKQLWNGMVEDILGPRKSIA